MNRSKTAHHNSARGGATARSTTESRRKDVELLRPIHNGTGTLTTKNRAGSTRKGGWFRCVTVRFEDMPKALVRHDRTGRSFRTNKIGVNEAALCPFVITSIN